MKRKGIKQKKLVPEVLNEVKRSVNKVGHALIAAPLEKALGKRKGKWFHENIWLQKDKENNLVLPEFVDKLEKPMIKNGKSRRKTVAKIAAAVAGVRPKGRRRKNKKKNLRRGRGQAPRVNRRPNLTGVSERGLGRIDQAFSAMTRAPGGRKLNMRTVAGLSMQGGFIRGTTELVSDVQILATNDSSNQNVPGYVLYQAPITPQSLAPNTRFASISTLYDQFVFDELSIELKPDMPFTENGILVGGFESNSLDALPPVGDILNVKKVMEHSNFHAESIINKHTISFPSDGRAAFKFAPGPKAGFYQNELPDVQADFPETTQGQLIIALHTPIADSTGQLGDSHVHSLGPLILHWRIRLKEAAENNDNLVEEDFYPGVVGGASSNPLNFSTKLEVQGGISDTSSLLLPFQFAAASGGRYLVEFEDVGNYELDFIVKWDTTGSANYGFEYAGDIADTLLKLDEQILQPQLSASNVLGGDVVRFKVLKPGAYLILVNYGTATSYVVGYSQFRVTRVPEKALALLRHPDFKIRSLAFCRLRDTTERDRLEKEVKRQLDLAGVKGVPTIERVDPYDQKIKDALCVYRAQKKAPRNVRRKDISIEDAEKSIDEQTLMRLEAAVLRRRRALVLDTDGWEIEEDMEKPVLRRFEKEEKEEKKRPRTTPNSRQSSKKD